MKFLESIFYTPQKTLYPILTMDLNNPHSDDFHPVFDKENKDTLTLTKDFNDKEHAIAHLIIENVLRYADKKELLKIKKEELVNQILNLRKYKNLSNVKFNSTITIILINTGLNIQNIIEQNKKDNLEECRLLHQNAQIIIDTIQLIR